VLLSLLLLLLLLLLAGQADKAAADRPQAEQLVVSTLIAKYLDQDPLVVDARRCKPDREWAQLRGGGG
jgi:hypothetical protein